MPLADALKLVGEDFLDYIQKARQRNIVIPDDVYNLLIDCIEERPLALREIQKMMKYIEDRQTAIFASINSPVPTGEVFKVFCFTNKVWRTDILCSEVKETVTEYTRPSLIWHLRDSGLVELVKMLILSTCQNCLHFWKICQFT